MTHKDYYIILHSILIGLTIMFYIKKWGELIQVRRHAIYVSVPILWSCIFVLSLLKTFQQHIDSNLSPYLPWGVIGTTACYYWIGNLLFPSTTQIDHKNQFIYFDYYEHFRKQHRWIIAFALIAFFLATFLFQSSPFIVADYALVGFLGLAFFAEHKGLMCLLAWLILSLLIFF